MKALYTALFRSLICTLIALALFGCEREIEIPFPESDPKLVVNSMATSGELLRVFVSRSLGMNEELKESDLYFTDATVELWEDSVFKENLTYFGFGSEREFGYYSTDPIEAGKHYALIARHPEYPEVRLEMTMPAALEISDLRYVPDAGPGPEGNPLVQFIAKLQDQANFDNYYAFRGTTLAVPKDSIFPTIGNSSSWQPLGTDLNNFSTLGYYVLRDEAFAGAETDVVFENDIASQFEYDRDEFPTQYISYTIISLNTPAFRLGDEYALHRNSQRFIDFDLSVLTQSPLPIYSNAQGGFGIFGGMTVLSDTLHI